MGGIDESLNPPAGPLVLSRRMFGKKMHAAVDVGIPLLVIAGDGLDDSSRLLRSGGVIEVHQFLAADLSREDGKSRRIFSTSNPVPTTCSRWAADSLDGILAAVVIRSPRRSFRYLRWMSRLRRCSPNLPLAADNCESIFQLARVRDLASYGPGTRSRKQRAGACVPRARRFRVSGDRTARSRRSGQWLLRGYTSHRRRKSRVAALCRFARCRRATGYGSSAWRRFSGHLCEQ